MLTQVNVYASKQPDLELPTTPEATSSAPIQIRNATGLGPAVADINISPFGSSDGGYFRGSTIAKRNIVLTLGFNPNWDDQTISSLRVQLYRYFMTKKKVRLRFITDEHPDMEIVGYVESCEPNIFSRDPEMQVSIICPNPDFVAVAATVVTGFTVSSTGDATIFDYIGTVPTGYILKIMSIPENVSFGGDISILHFVGDQIGSADDLVILELASGVAVINATGYFEMSSVHGSKWIRRVLVADPSDYTNLLADWYVSPWPQLERGENQIAVNVGPIDDGQAWSVTYFAHFGGI